MLTAGSFYLSTKVLARYIDPKGIKNQKHPQIPVPYWYQKMQQTIYVYPSGILKKR